MEEAPIPNDEAAIIQDRGLLEDLSQSLQSASNIRVRQCHRRIGVDESRMVLLAPPRREALCTHTPCLRLRAPTLS